MTLLAWIPHVPLRNWLLNGVTAIAHLYSEGSLKPFSDLKAEFQVPNAFFFQYLHVRHTLSSITWPSRPALQSSFTRFLLGTGGLQKGLSIKFYHPTYLVLVPNVVYAGKRNQLQHTPLKCGTLPHLFRSNTPPASTI